MKNKNIFLVILGIMGINLISKANSSSYTKALNFIRDAEGGFYPNAYLDSGNVPTIGFGSTYNFDKKRPVAMTDKINESTAEKWLQMEANKNANEIKSLVKVPLTNNQISSLISFTYNVGLPAFKKSTILKLINSKADKNVIAKEFDRWIYDNGQIVKGLINRRNAEKKLFLS